MCGCSTEKADSAGDCNYINLHTQLILPERRHHTVLMKSNEIIWTSLMINQHSNLVCEKEQDHVGFRKIPTNFWISWVLFYSISDDTSVRCRWYQKGKRCSRWLLWCCDDMFPGYSKICCTDCGFNSMWSNKTSEQPLHVRYSFKLR